MKKASLVDIMKHYRIWANYLYYAYMHSQSWLVTTLTFFTITDSSSLSLYAFLNQNTTGNLVSFRFRYVILILTPDHLSSLLKPYSRLFLWLQGSNQNRRLWRLNSPTSQKGSNQLPVYTWFLNRETNSNTAHEYQKYTLHRPLSILSCHSSRKLSGAGEEHYLYGLASWHSWWSWLWS